MGQQVSKLSGQIKSYFGRKRKNEYASIEDGGQPKKRNCNSAEYIHKRLFIEGSNSDIVLTALGKNWRLHKVYLCQSEYFNCMFNGSWLESTKDVIHLIDLDDQINIEAMDAVLASLYSDEININDSNVVPVLATVKLLQLESIIVLCNQFMIDNICNLNVLQYLEAAERYGCVDVRKNCFHWLEINLHCRFARNISLLQGISIEIMEELLESDEFVVWRSEVWLYTMLRTWVYIRFFTDIYPGEIFDEDYANIKVSGFFRSRSKECCFLETPEGHRYIKVFQSLRTEYLVNHVTVFSAVVKDNIIPKLWIDSHSVENWKYLLKVNYTKDVEPLIVDGIVFNKRSMRSSCELPEVTLPRKLLWCGFQYGIDVQLVYDENIINLRRRSCDNPISGNFKSSRDYIVQISLISLNERLQPISIETSEILTVMLAKNEEKELIRIKPDTIAPLISFRVLLKEPIDVSVKQIPLCINEAKLEPAQVEG